MAVTYAGGRPVRSSATDGDAYGDTVPGFSPR
jgi:hypothetical protein